MRSVPILIVGGGAAGMMAAAAVSGCGKKALIIEKMNQLGKKNTCYRKWQMQLY